MRPFTAKILDPIIDAGDGVDLRALRPEDDVFLNALLSEPNVAKWFKADADDLIDLIDEPTVSPFLIRREGAAIGYAQVYWANGDAFWRGLGMPAETMGFDLALTEALQHQGIGPRVIQALTGRVFSMDGAVQTIIDPDPDNARAIRAYRKCGFVFGPPQAGYEGDPMVLGILRREEWRPK